MIETDSQIDAAAPRPGGILYSVGCDPRVRDTVRLIADRLGMGFSTVSTRRDFLRELPQEASCAIVEDPLPDGAAVDLLADLRQREIVIPLVVVGFRATVRDAVSVMEAGAKTYLEPPLEPEFLAPRVRAFVEENAVERETSSVQQAIRERYAKLTPKEIEVVQRVLEGRTNREIAAELEISVRAVEDRRSRIMRRMQAESLVNLVDLIRAAQRA